MKLEMIHKTYKCDVVLSSGAEVSADLVTVQDGKVVNVNNGSVAVEIGEEKRYFNFSIYNHGESYNLNNAPAEVDVRAIILDFISVVEAEIA